MKTKNIPVTVIFPKVIFKVQEKSFGVLKKSHNNGEHKVSVKLSASGQNREGKLFPDKKSGGKDDL